MFRLKFCALSDLVFADLWVSSKSSPFTTVRHRLASFLVRLAQKEGKPNADGIEVTLPVSNQELASQIGTVRELVSRNLSRLQAEGLIKMDGRSVIVLDLKGLEAELSSPK